jgi:hypothetical protein
MNRRESVAGHESACLSSLDSAEQAGRWLRPWFALEQDIKEKVDVEEELHVPCFSRRWRR